MLDKVQKHIERYEELESELARPEIAANQEVFARLHKSMKDMEKAVAACRRFVQISKDFQEWKTVLNEESDPEMIAAAKEELPKLESEIQERESELQILLVPADPHDHKSAIIEIRAGTGGDESSLFAGDLFRMYRKYCEIQNWKMEVTSVSEGTVGGYKEIIFAVNGPGVYGTLKFESGVHRVQRVPDTESQGRVHTSAATVAVLPEADDVEVEVNESELRIDTYRASGSGGQHVNKTDSAIRITHIPTGIVVSCQDEKSQHKNKAKALKQLRSKLLDMALSEKEQKEAASRKSQVGTGDRSAKIRTYNFPQGRVTDHRINLTLYRLEAVVSGDIQELIDALRLANAQEKLQQSI